LRNFFKNRGNHVGLRKQKSDGSWWNENARWMESNPILVTAYTVMSLEQIYYSIPSQS